MLPEGGDDGEVTMTRMAIAIATGGLLLVAGPVAASLTVTPGLTVHNQCARDVAIAVHYKDIRGSWKTSGFTTVRARERRHRVVSSDNSVFYYYAESRAGNRWTGSRHFKVDGKAYPMREARLAFDRGSNSFTLELTCNR